MKNPILKISLLLVLCAGFSAPAQEKEETEDPAYYIQNTEIAYRDIPETYQEIKDYLGETGGSYYKIRVLDRKSGSITAEVRFSQQPWQNTELPAGVYLFNTGATVSTLRVSEEKIQLPPASYLYLPYTTNPVIDIRTGGLFGTRLRMTTRPEDASRYYLLRDAHLKKPSNSNGALTLQSGDLDPIKQDYATYLYQILQPYSR